MTTLARPNVCLGCVHLDRSGALQPRCAAFEVIPSDIWSGASDHQTPREGDGGVVFEPDPEFEQLHAVWLTSRASAR